MKRVSSMQSLADIGHLRNVLEQAGIRCVIRNEQLSGAIGEIPFIDCMPELWVVDETKLALARKIIDEFGAEPPPGADWQCGQCGQINERQFAVCWQCGAIDRSP